MNEMPSTTESAPTSTTEARATTTRAVGSTVAAGATTTSRAQTATTQPGLTANEDLRINPPPPRNVRVVDAVAGRVVLAWDEPPPVAVPHTYSDRVVGYRVYRRPPNGTEFVILGTSTERTYVDDTARAGQRYGYQVSSIRERDVEGTRSDPVETTVA